MLLKNHKTPVLTLKMRLWYP